MLTAGRPILFPELLNDHQQSRWGSEVARNSETPHPVYRECMVIDESDRVLAGA